MIRNTIFDIGGVLFDYNEKIYLDKLNIEESTGGLNKNGLWINLQGKDRAKRLEENKKKAERESKEFNPKMKIKTELKLHVMYEGWQKGDPRHSLVNKQYNARDLPKQYRNLITELINKKEYEKIKPAINGLRYELCGEYKAMKKLNKLESYLSNDLARYQDVLEVPEAPEGIEYRNMGT